MALLEEFRQWGYQSSPTLTFKYLDMFLTAVKFMIQNKMAEREGSWRWHLTSIAAILLYMCFSNRVNYYLRHHVAGGKTLSSGYFFFYLQQG